MTFENEAGEEGADIPGLEILEVVEVFRPDQIGFHPAVLLSSLFKRIISIDRHKLEEQFHAERKNAAGNLAYILRVLRQLVHHRREPFGIPEHATPEYEVTAGDINDPTSGLNFALNPRINISSSRLR